MKRKKKIAPFWAALDPLDEGYMKLKRAKQSSAKKRFDDDFNRVVTMIQNKCRKWGYAQDDEGRRQILALFVVALFPETNTLPLWLPEVPSYDELLQKYLEDTELAAEVKRHRKS